MNKIAYLMSIFCVLGADFALGQSPYPTTFDSGVTVALICDSEESCAHLGGVIEGSDVDEPITIAVICDSDENCTHLSGVLTSEAPKTGLKYKVLPMKLLRH